MVSLKEALAEAKKKRVAIGHFNIGDFAMLRAVIDAALKLNVPVIVGFSEGERKFFPLRQAALYVKSVSEQIDHPVYINADHTYSLDLVKQAIDAGVDSVTFDGAKLSYEENLSIAKECVEYARASGRDVLVEGELGFIGSGSEIIESLPEGAVITEENMTKPEEASQFVEETGVDLFAPAVGNIHGILKGADQPNINPERIKAIAEAVSVPLVLHGGSGISDEEFGQAIKSGIREIHVATELRVVYRDALRKSLDENPDLTTPYKIMTPVKEAVQKTVEEKLRLFNGM